jgi:hypothetical protein
MTLTAKTTIRSISAVIVVAASLASSALAAGEPKNEIPFTRLVSTDRVATLAIGVNHTASHASSGEAKNVLPFTRR